MTLSMLPVETLIFLLVDLALLVTAGIMALVLPANPWSQRAELGQATTIVGFVAFVRGLWRLLGLPSTVMNLLELSADVPARIYLQVGAGVLATLLFVALGYLLSYRAIAAQMGEGGARNAVAGLGNVLYRMRAVLGVLAILAAIVIILPYLPSGGPVRRRRRF